VAHVRAVGTGVSCAECLFFFCVRRFGAGFGSVASARVRNSKIVWTGRVGKELLGIMHE